jgi:hypothetical protein
LLLPVNAGRRFLLWADKMRTYSLLGLILSWRLFGSLFEPIFAFAVRAIYR